MVPEALQTINKAPLFFVGLHMPNHAPQFDKCMVSVNRLKTRKSDFYPNQWIMDSGAFTEISTYGEYRTTVEEYANHINRWKVCGEMLAAVSQDYMCEPFILNKTGMTVGEHQQKTIERYDALLPLTNSYVLPVLQGFDPFEYQQHIAYYGDRLKNNAWVGVGSVCKRNSKPSQVENVLLAIKQVRPDLRLHGFGLKRTALQSGCVSDLLYSCDSMAWSFHGRKIGRGNDVELAKEYVQDMASLRVQGSMLPRLFNAVQI